MKKTSVMHNANSMKLVLIPMLYFFCIGLINAQSPNDTMIRISKIQIITANQTKVFADSCKVHTERLAKTNADLMDVVISQDGEINALRHANTICDDVAGELKKDVANEQKRTKRERFWKRVSSGVMIAEFAVIIGLGISIIINH